MAHIPVRVHPSSNISFKPLDEQVGVIQMRMTKPSDNGGPPEQIDCYGLGFQDPDGETHIYVRTDEGRHNLIAQLTGGLHIPTIEIAH